MVNIAPLRKLICTFAYIYRKEKGRLAAALWSGVYDAPLWLGRHRGRRCIRKAMACPGLGKALQTEANQKCVDKTHKGFPC